MSIQNIDAAGNYFQLRRGKTNITDDDWAALVLLIILAAAGCFALWVQSRATAHAPVVHNDTSALALHLPAAEDAEGSHPGRDMDKLASTPQGMTGRGWTAGELNSKVTCWGVPINVAGVLREVFADLFFKRDCITTRGLTEVRLTLDQVDMYIRNCCTKHCSSVKQSCALFIHRMIIQVCPRSWAQHCQRVKLKPHLTPEVHALQRHSGSSIQMSIGNVNRGSFSYQKGKSVSRKTPAIEWVPASTNESTKPGTWEWKLSRFTNGSKLVFNKFKWGSMQHLGIQPSHVHYPPGSFEAEACWELPPNEGMQQQPLEWDMKDTGSNVQTSKSIDMLVMDLGGVGFTIARGRAAAAIVERKLRLSKAYLATKNHRLHYFVVDMVSNSHLESSGRPSDPEITDTDIRKKVPNRFLDSRLVP